MKTQRQHLLATTFLCAASLIGVGGVAVATFSPTVASAQDLTSGTLEGRVVTSAGAPVSGAKVTVTSNSRGFSETFTTDANGVFRLSQAPIGEYTVTVSATGYQDLTQGDLAVTLGRVSRYDLPLASTTEVAGVVVTGVRRRPSVDFDRATTGVVVDVQQTASQLPVSRDIQGIASIAPQITISKSFSASQLSTRPDNPTGDASIAGSSPAENIFYINGMNVTNFRNFLGGSTVPFEFYDQVEIKTGGYSAEYGRSTGGAIIAVSRSGSNTFHGGVNAYWEPQSLREYSKPTAIDSTLSAGVYTNSYNLPTEKDAQAYEGNVWLSGPIFKDRLFFFGFYNPRHYEVKSATSSTESSTPNDFSNTQPSVYDVVTRKDPFYGGRLDLNIVNGHRLTATWFRDNQNSQDAHYTLNNDGVSYTRSTTNNYSGGLNSIYNYTGRFTDWLTISALYGESTFSQASIGELDGQAAVYTPQAADIVRGNPNLLIATGEDVRKNTRVDADIYFSAFGDHHVRIGYDREELTASQNQQYSGGVYYRYYGAGQDCGGTGTLTDNCVRVRQLFNAGSWDILQQGVYIQDAWNVNDRLSLGIGIRAEDFNNKNAGGDSFVHAKNQIAPRLSATYDLFGDKTTKLSAFYGRYHLPVAGNTNIRGSGGETFLEDYYIYSGRDATTLVPNLSQLLLHRCLEGTDTGTVCNPEYPSPAQLRSANLKPQYQDEYILGLEHRYANDWTVSANLIYRDLKNVVEDANINNPLGWNGGGNPNNRRASAYCVYANIPAPQCGNFGNSGYVLVNPGKDAVLQLDSTWGALSGQTVVVPASVIGLPEAKRTYKALEIKFSRPFDGKWSLDGSYVLSRSYGNYEGGVKSDTSQSDTGGTSDFDQPGWMRYSTGLLPNNHTHQLKLHGVYQVFEPFRVGATVQVISPRSYGCIGYYPQENQAVPLGDRTHLYSWFCNGGQPTPRGKSFKGDWIKTLDLTFSYDLKAPVAGKLQLRADVFNVFNSHDTVIFNEFGENGSFGTRDYAYRTPSLYQEPRYVRLGVNYSF